jgi:hypothetical protein
MPTDSLDRAAAGWRSRRRGDARISQAENLLDAHGHFLRRRVSPAGNIEFRGGGGMRKFAAVTCLALGLAAVPGTADAGPIGTNGCSLNASDVSECNLYADYTGSGASGLGAAEGNLGGYLLGYTFLLNQAANLADGFQASDVAHILVVHDTLFELFSNTVFNGLFDDIFSAASSGAPIDNVSPTNGQLAGCPPVPAGVPNLSGVGYCTTADLVTVYANWGDESFGGQDILQIHTALPPDLTGEEPPPDPAPVPEPGTLSLLVLGGSSALAALRRRRRGQQPAAA